MQDPGNVHNDNTHSDNERNDNRLSIDGQSVSFSAGQTIMEAATTAGIYIPHLCHHPDYPPEGNCRLCSVKIGGRYLCACTTPAASGISVESQSEELTDLRRALTELLFVEGNHQCPGCERSGNCQLQAMAYFLEMQDSHFHHQYPRRELDASHPQVLLDRDRCILCGLCVRASKADGKEVFAIGGRGANTSLRVCTDSGLLGDSNLSIDDRAAHICPVGALLIRGEGFSVPIGSRLYDAGSIDKVGHQHPLYGPLESQRSAAGVAVAKAPRLANQTAVPASGSLAPDPLAPEPKAPVPTVPEAAESAAEDPARQPPSVKKTDRGAENER